MTVMIREGTDFSTYKSDETNVGGWAWYCMHCDTRGSRWARRDARKDARSHLTQAHPELSKAAPA